MKLRLELDITFYDPTHPDGIPADKLDYLRSRLLHIVDRAADHGQMTGDDTIEVDSWESRVVRLDP